MQDESIETGKQDQATDANTEDNQGTEMEGLSEENLSLIEKLNRELAETGKLYSELSEEVEPDSGEADTEAPHQAEAALEESEQALEETSSVDEPQEAEAQAPDSPESPEPKAADAAFDLIPEPLRVALAQKGYDELTTVQLAVLDPETKGRDLQVSSQTGSGKTVALGILIAEQLIEAVEAGANERPLALVITPTRELASQVQKELNWLFAKVRGLSVTVCTGGTSVGMERRNLERGPAVVVGTPGRLLDHMTSGALRCEGIAQVVLDEADQMLDMGFREELEGILERTPEERATHLVSATFPAGIQKLARRYQNNPAQVEGTRLGEANADIEHVAHLVFEPDRYAALINLLLLTENERVLIFVNTRADTSDMAEALSKDGFSAMPLSGELVQAQRTRTLAAFRSGAVKILVATDVAARGLDIPDVGLVIQAATPMDAEVYIHRSGRTGRAGQKGRCVLLVPARRERRLKRMLNDAGVDSNWCDIPTRDQVEKSLNKRARRRLFEAIDDESSILEEDLTYAQKLVDERDPVRVIATLLRLSKPATQREAMDIEPAQPFSRGWKHKERERMQDTRERSQGAPQRPGRPNHSGADYVRFQVSFGFRDGANPQRLLAMVCRRGDISGRMIGSIDLGPTESSFEVRAEEAARFEQQASQSDPREPGVRISRGEGTPQRSPGGYQGRGGKGFQRQGGGERSYGGGHRGRQGDGRPGRSFHGGERSYGGQRSYGGGGYQGRGEREQRSSSYGDGQRAYGYQGHGGQDRQRSEGYGGRGYQGRGGDQRQYGGQGRERQDGGYQGRGQRSGGYQERDHRGGYQGGGQRSGRYQGEGQDQREGGYQGRYQGRQAGGPPDDGQRGEGYGDGGSGGGAPRRGFQKRGGHGGSRPYGRNTGYRSNSGDHSSGGGYRGRR